LDCFSLLTAEHFGPMAAAMKALRLMNNNRSLAVRRNLHRRDERPGTSQFCGTMWSTICTFLTGKMLQLGTLQTKSLRRSNLDAFWSTRL
jgi:hypothetical protein